MQPLSERIQAAIIARLRAENKAYAEMVDAQVQDIEELRAFNQLKEDVVQKAVDYYWVHVNGGPKEKALTALYHAIEALRKHYVDLKDIKEVPHSHAFKEGWQAPGMEAYDNNQSQPEVSIEQVVDAWPRWKRGIFGNVYPKKEGR